MTKNNTKRIFCRLFALGLLAGAFAAGGCESASSTLAGEGRKITQDSPVEVTKGMPAADLLAELGEPDEIRPAEPAVEGAEVWVYRRNASNVDMKITGTKETPHYDPITGAYQPIIDPIYQAQTSTVREEIVILMVEGAVEAWKVNRRADKNFN